MAASVCWPAKLRGRGQAHEQETADALEQDATVRQFLDVRNAVLKPAMISRFRRAKASQMN
jgi:hypothetical protein